MAQRLVENYGDPHLHHGNYPLAQDFDISGMGCVKTPEPPQCGCDELPKSACGSLPGQLVEHYGDPHLHHGDYPVTSGADAGGCFPWQTGSLQIDKMEQTRVAARDARMQQRGGNNPFDLDAVPKGAKHGYQVGVGCMNAGCHCKNCHYDCVCGPDGCFDDGGSQDGYGMGMRSDVMGIVEGVMQTPAFQWAAMLAVAFFIYKLLMKKR